MSEEVFPFSQAGRGKPSPYADNARVPARYSQYGEVFVQAAMPWPWAMADEGSYFVWHNATNDASTTVAGHAAPVLADADATMTKPLVFLRTALSSASTRRIYLDFIEIEVVTAGANGTAANWAAQLDSGTTRYSSGGEDATTLSPNMQSTATPALTPKLGAVVVGAENSTVRHLGHGQLRATIEVAGDKKIFLFGRDAQVVAASAAAAVREQIVNMPPVILGPTDQFLLALYAPSQTVAGVYKIRGGFVER